MLNNTLGVFVSHLNNHVALDAADQAALLSLPHTVRTGKTMDYIVREGSVPNPCAILLSGFAIRQKIEAEGARQIVGIQIPGDALDMQHLFLDCADHNVQALGNVELANIPRAALQQIAMARPTIAHAFAVNNQIEASIAREWLLNIGRRDARRRMAHLLCEVAVRLERQHLAAEYHYELPMTQEQLADTLGLTAVHVNRTLKGLETEGLITRAGRAVRIVRPLELQDVAGFSANYLHLKQQKAAAQ